MIAAEGHTPLRRLHAVDGGEASFLALDPRQVLDGYRCELSDGDRARIGADAATPLLWLTLVTVEANGAVSVNLRADRDQSQDDDGAAGPAARLRVSAA